MSDWSDLLDQLKADFSSKQEKEDAIKERDKLMSEMEFQNRAQHQLSKDYPTYSQAYGNRSIYNPKQDLSGFAENPSVEMLLKNLQDNFNYDNLKTHSYQLRNIGQNMAAEALAKDQYKTTDPLEFTNQLKQKDRINYEAATNPDLYNVKNWWGQYNPNNKQITLDESVKNDLGTWLHEHLHALNDQTVKNKETQTEGINGIVPSKERVQEAIKNKDIAELRRMFSGGHFQSKPNTLPELYVQDKVEQDMKNRGFETRKDPIKSRFERLKQLMRY